MSGPDPVPGLAPALVSGPLTSVMVARAVIAAAAEYGVDPQTVYEPVRDGRGRARMLAAAALIHPQDRPAGLCAKALGLNVVQISPSGLARRGVTAAALSRVGAALSKAPAAAQACAPLKMTVRPRRGDPDYVDPRRDTARDARMLAARRAGEGPRSIAKREGMSLGVTKAFLSRVAAQTGETYPEVAPGPNRGGRPKRVRTEAETAAKAKPRVRKPRPGATSDQGVDPSPDRPAAPAPAPVAPPVRVVDPFPADHSAWAPLPGTTPVRLIDHKTGCRWPVTVEGARDRMVCDAPVQVAQGCGPYCGRHVWLSLAPAARSRMSPFAPAPVTAPRMACAAGASELKDA